MLCKECSEKPMARGIKKIKCACCAKQTIVNVSFVNRCAECSNKMSKCECCGKQITSEDNAVTTDTKIEEILDKIRDYVNDISTASYADHDYGTKYLETEDILKFIEELRPK